MKPEHRDPRPIMGAKEGRALARRYAAEHPEDTEFAWYLSCAERVEWVEHSQWTGEDDDGNDVYSPVWTRTVEWFYVPDDYSAPKVAQKCYSSGGVRSGPGSRGQWYLHDEFTWQRPADLAVPGEQIAMAFA